MNQDYTPDRRVQRRYKPPKPSIKMFFLLLFDKTALTLFSRKGPLIIIAIVFTLACTSILWSLYVRLPSINQSVDLLNQQQSVQSNLDQLKSTISAEELKLIEQRISQAQSRIFDSFPEFAKWLMNKSEFAKKLELNMSYRLLSHENTSLNDVIAVTTEIDLQVKQDTAEKAYVRLLAFIRSFIDENWHLEILGNQFNSQGKGITTMTLRISVWLKDKGTINQLIQTKEALNETFIQ